MKGCLIKRLCCFGFAVMLLSACGSKKNEASSTSLINSDFAQTQENGGAAAKSVTNDEAQIEEVANDEEEPSELERSSEAEGIIKKDMIVYSGALTIETVEFDKSYQALKNQIEANEGFVENESLNNSSTVYSNGFRTYTANVRIPSKNYDTFMGQSGNFGSVKAQSSNAENVSRQYSETAKALEIYEAKEKRYIEQIASAQSEETVIALEDRLTDIQVQIATLKTRKTMLETDVAYSSVNINLTEVSVITEGEDSTFIERIKDALKGSARNFLETCEDLLIGLIYAVPIIFVLAVIVLIFIAIIKLIIKLTSKRKKKPSVQNTPPSVSSQSEQEKNNESKIVKK